MIGTLPKQADEPLEQIISYYSYLETMAYKLVHYKGFCFGDLFLKMVVLGYCQNYLLTNMYTNKLEKDCIWLACLKDASLIMVE